MKHRDVVSTLQQSRYDEWANKSAAANEKDFHLATPFYNRKMQSGSAHRDGSFTAVKE